MRDGDIFRASEAARQCGAKLLEQEQRAKDQGLRIDYVDPEVYFDGLTIPVRS